MSQSPTEPDPRRASLHQLRLLVAGVCKDLMRARLAAQTTAFASVELDAWGVEAGTPPRPAWQYLQSAARNLGRLVDEFGPEYLGSSLGHPDHEPPEQWAIRGCDDLVSSGEFERPDSYLRWLAGEVRRESAGEWWTRLRWDELRDLREKLNLLPEAEEPSRPRLRWEAGTGRLSLDDELVMTLTKVATNQRKILDRFQAARWAYSVTFTDTRTDDDRRVPWIENAIRDLNKRQRHVRFVGDGSGDGVCYQIVEAESPPVERP